MHSNNNIMTIYQNVDVDVEVEISVDEFLTGCTNREIKEVVKWLIDNDYTYESLNDTRKSANEIQFAKNLDKIKYSYSLLTKDDEEIITNISKNF